MTSHRLAVLLLISGCAGGVLEAPAPAATRTHALLDADAPNWMVVGDDGRAEMVGGTDGEPNAMSGRFVLGGSAVLDAASGTDRWLVVGATRTQALDDDALRLAEAREALTGATITLIEPSPTGFVVGGTDGRLQRLDALGDPEAAEVALLDGATITAAAFNGTNWLIGGANGNAVVVNAALDTPANPAGATVQGGISVRAVVADPTGALSPPYLAFTDNTAIAMSALGNPQGTTPIAGAGQITTAEFAAGKVAIGTSDGRVGIADYSATPSFTFANVLGGGAVRRLAWNGNEWLALGANGQAQRVSATGGAQGSAVQVSSRADQPLVGAHWTGTRWLIVVGEIGFVAFTDEQLAAPRTLTAVLGGADIFDASPARPGVLVVGAGGAFQLLDDLGEPVGGVGTVSGGPDLHAASWNGDHWLVAGEGGAAQLVDAEGVAMGGPTTVLGGADVRFAAWSGEFYLVGGAGGMVQVVRADGSASSPPFAVTGATDLYAARWSGTAWLVVGTDGAAGAFARLVPSDTAATAASAPDISTLRAVDFNGLEFLVGGDGGLVQRVSTQGVLTGNVIDALTGFDVADVHFNGLNYVVVGEHGAFRRLGQDYAPLRAPIGLLDGRSARAVVWTAARGFPSGPCLTDELCFAGPCVGGLTAGRCCDTACDRPCESCFQDDTGEPDGTCAPVVAGKQPPAKSGSAGCPRQSEATCGLTGSCDGAGECAFYGADIPCADAVCSLGRYTPASACNGMGACGLETELDCAPYVGCNIEGCVTSCNADQDCVSGFACREGACVEATDEPDPEPPADDADDKGCCATTGAAGGEPAALMLLAAVAALRRRRR